MTEGPTYPFVVRSWRSSWDVSNFMLKLRITGGYQMTPGFGAEHWRHVLGIELVDYLSFHQLEIDQFTTTCILLRPTIH